jgi:hypothetical protein
MFGLEENFQGSCLSYFFPKVCQYVTIDEKCVKISSMFLLSSFNQICINV